MLGDLWNFLLYKPLLNALAFLVSVIPGGDIGIAVILLTILVKLILFPLSQHQLRNQAAMNMLSPEINKIKKSGASREEQARLTLELYKKHKTNPLSGCLVFIPVIFVLIALYSVFFRGLEFNSELLYSFIHIPKNMNMMFLGLLDISKASLALAALAALSQYFQSYFMPQPAKTSEDGASFQDVFAKSASMQMKYFLPVMIFFFLYTGIPGVLAPLPGTMALYWITNNIFTILQQVYVKKTERGVLSHEAEALALKK